MAGHTNVTGATAVLVLLSSVYVFARSEPEIRTPCVLLDSGLVCGLRRKTGNDSFASFLGVPYARQPVGELRFQELQPVEPWNTTYEATKEGPICPQKDVFYGRIMQPKIAPSEACIHANVHVPIYALPDLQQVKPAKGLQPPHKVVKDDDSPGKSPGLPILVFIHGGGFAFGSGDTDLYGPEYLVSQGIIVITFNYRLNVFGFLSLNNSYIPGNNGLRDMVTLLRWVRTNARAFGGNPNDVTLGGHSAGAASAHLLTLSKAATGLFKRTILMSGTALPTFYTTEPLYAQFVSKMFLQSLSINSTNPEEVHRQLIVMPLDKLMQAHNYMQDLFGMGVFYPVVESSDLPNFTTILDDDPEALLVQGRGNDIPLMVGFTDAECYGFLPRFKQINILARIKENPIIMTPPQLIYKRPPEVASEIARIIQKRYFHGEPTMDEYVKSCSEANFIYPAIKTAQMRANTGGKPVYLYEFSYQSEVSIKKKVDMVDYKGAGHLEDVTYVFRVNSILVPKGKVKPTINDEHMKNWMVEFITNFTKYSDPVGKRKGQPSYATPWPPLTKLDMKYQDINIAHVYRILELNNQQREMIHFFDSLQNRTS